MNPVLLAAWGNFIGVAGVAAALLGHQRVSDVVLTVGTLLAQGADGAAQINALAAQLRQMVAENRNPTEAEWLLLKSQSDVLHESIQNA